MKSSKFRTKALLNVFYSAVITCLIEIAAVFLILKAGRTEPVVVLFFVLFGIAIFAYVFWQFQKATYNYISEISKTMNEIASGDLAARATVEGDNEFSEMAYNLNSMTDKLQNLMEKERESEKTKNELITNIAHDLRTPLTSIIGYLELLSKKKDVDMETREKYTDIAYEKSKKLYKLIEDLFGFTKLSYGKIAMKPEKIDIVKLLSQLMEEFYPNFAEKNLKYDLTSNVTSKEITGDGGLLARLFDNLINNAIKYGADGKQINVRIEAQDDIVTVSVINYGQVIPSDELPYVFDKFYRVEQSRSRKTGGTGLGLAIAKEIAEMHNGHIAVESDLKGTRFIVTLVTDFDINKENFENA